MMNETLHKLIPKTDFEKLMVAEAVITDLKKQHAKLLDVIQEQQREINQLNYKLSNQKESQKEELENAKKIKQDLEAEKKRIFRQRMKWARK